MAGGDRPLRPLLVELDPMCFGELEQALLFLPLAGELEEGPGQNPEGEEYPSTIIRAPAVL